MHKGKYRQLKTRFRTDSLDALNRRIPAEKNYAFGLKPSSVYGLESDLMIYEDDIGIDSKGTGKQVFNVINKANDAGYTDHILITKETARNNQIQHAVDAFKAILQHIVEKEDK